VVIFGHIWEVLGSFSLTKAHGTNRHGCSLPGFFDRFSTFVLLQRVLSNSQKIHLSRLVHFCQYPLALL